MQPPLNRPASRTQTEARPVIPAGRGWGPIILLPIGVLILTPQHWPRWVFMWLLAFVIFAGCKWLTWRRTPSPEAHWWQHAGYLFAWPGLNARSFLSSRRLPAANRPSAKEWGAALTRLSAGAVLFWVMPKWIASGQEILFGWVGMAGLILILHFGMFHLLSCAWRTAGIEAQPLMIAPLSSNSISEFWGRRWNTAFRDFTYRFLFHPLTSRLGPSRAVFVGFLFSGLIHDLVISVPARGGYGWPTVFFGTQALAITMERSQFGRAIGLGRGWTGRLFAVVVLTIPAFGLFHPPFVRNVIVPFMKALGVRMAVH